MNAASAILVSSFRGGDSWRPLVDGERRVTVRKRFGVIKGDVRIVTECKCDDRQKTFRGFNTPLPLCASCGGWFDRPVCVCDHPVDRLHAGSPVCRGCGGSKQNS